MALLFDRKIVVETADLIIFDPKIRLDIKTSLSSNPNDGKVEIYNLSPDRRRNIKERGGVVRVSAGYGSAVSLLTEQTIQEVTHPRDKLDRITRISLGGQIARQARQPLLGGITNVVYRGTVNVRTIASNIITRDLGLLVGDVRVIPNFTATDWGWSGQSTEGLKILLADLNVNAYEENGVVYFNKIGAVNSEAPALRISPENGLIGVPEETDEGAMITTFLDPLARPGALIELESQDLSGEWKAISIHHVGTNWVPGPFETHMELRPITAAPVTIAGDVGFGD